jgi:hypothetical protein
MNVCPSAKCEKALAFNNGCTGLYGDRFYRAGCGGLNHVIHFHGLKHEDLVAGADGVANRDINADYSASKGAGHVTGTACRWCCWSCRSRRGGRCAGGRGSDWGCWCGRCSYSTIISVLENLDSDVVGLTLDRYS